MRRERRIWLGMAGVFAATAILRGDPGDAEGSRDYGDFIRLPGFVISDFDEDNPAPADFLVSRPMPDDVGHVEAVRVRGHRFVIRYEWMGPGVLPSIYKAQQGFEKRATDAGYKIEKTGAAGNVSETFHKTMNDGHDVWVRLDPTGFYNVLTIVEAVPSAPARLTSSPPPPTLTLPAPKAPEVAASVKPDAGSPNSAVTPVPAPQPAIASKPQPAPKPAVDPNDDSLYDSLTRDGRVVVPFSFRPGKDDLAESSQVLVQQVAAMMKRHPEIFLRIEGHTDDSGDAQENLRLSSQRAMAIQKALIDTSVDKLRLDAIGVGGLQPLADNRTAEGREKNRRIELVLWKKLPGRVPATHTTTGA